MGVVRIFFGGGGTLFQKIFKKRTPKAFAGPSTEKS